MSSARILRRHLTGAAALTGVIALSACATQAAPPAGNTGPASGYPVTVANCGADLTIDKEPKSILTIGTSAISMLDAAGAADRITARAGEFGADLPTGLRHDPSAAPVLDGADPAIETIVGADPDIIVGYGLFNASDDDVAKAGIPNLIIEGECSHDAAVTGKTDFETVFTDIERLSRVFGTQEVATPRITELRSELDELNAAAPAQEGRPTAAVLYYFSKDAPVSARGGLGIADDVLKRAGFTNVYGDEQSVYLNPNLETLLEKDPHTIVLTYGFFGESFADARDRFLKEPGVADLTAVKEDRIIGVRDSDLAPDPGALRGLRTILESTGALTK